MPLVLTAIETNTIVLIIKFISGNHKKQIFKEKKTLPWIKWKMYKSQNYVWSFTMARKSLGRESNISRLPSSGLLVELLLALLWDKLIKILVSKSKQTNIWLRVETRERLWVWDNNHNNLYLSFNIILLGKTENQRKEASCPPWTLRG